MIVFGEEVPPVSAQSPFIILITSVRTSCQYMIGCLLRGNRVTVPPEGRLPVMELLQEGHLGNARMAQSFVWWPGTGYNLEKVKVPEDDAQSSTSSTTPMGTSQGVSLYLPHWTIPG